MTQHNWFCYLISRVRDNPAKNQKKPTMLKTTITTPVKTRSYAVSLHRTYTDPGYGQVHAYDQIQVCVPEGYTPGFGGEIARVEAYTQAEYPGWEITQLSLTEEPDVEF